ncbi:MAG: hemerythrin domain-containing protein [Chloroflexi bacterium]|nr:hemerythrin domain-containing protein [Chloroflexota bacterium]
MLPTEVLMKDHRVIERLCRVLNAAAARLDTGDDADPQVFERSLRFIREFADSYHHGREEDLLFPALEAHGVPREGGPTGVMVLDHNQGRASVQAMAQALQRWATGDASARAEVARHARAYSQLLLEHIPKEDNILYPIADSVLEPEEQQALLKKFQAVETQRIGDRYQEYVKLVEELEAQVGPALRAPRSR